MGKKLLMLLGAFLVIYLLNFSIPRLMPGDPFDYTSGAAGDDVDAAYSEEQKELLRAYYGLDKPFFPQLRDTIVDNLHGDFGQSIHYKRPVADILLERLPWSLWIMGSTLALSLLLGVALALLCVRRPWADRALYPALSALAEVPPSSPACSCSSWWRPGRRGFPSPGPTPPSPSTTACGSGWGTSWCTA